MAKKGILLGEDGDLLILNKALAIGSSEMQEVGLILQMNQGEQKFKPLLGPNLVKLIKAKKSRFDIERRVKINLAMDDKDYDNIKNKLQIR